MQMDATSRASSSQRLLTKGAPPAELCGERGAVCTKRHSNIRVDRYTQTMAVLVPLGTQKLDSEVLGRKQDHLFALLKGFGRVMVAYSGGTDSAYLAWAAHHVLG